jgi:amino acid permease
MKMLAYLLAIVCLIAAVMYFVMPGGSLPTFMPGYEVGSAHIHHRHAIVALVAAVVLFVIGWFIGRRR